MNKNIFILSIFLFSIIIFSNSVIAVIPSNPVHVFTFNNITNTIPNFLIAEVGTLNFSGVVTQNVVGRSGEGFFFNNQFMNRTDSSVLNITDGVNATISLWVKYNSTTAYMNILHPSNNPPNALLWTNVGSNGLLSVNINNGIDITTGGTDNNQYNNILITIRDDGLYALYVNGEFRYNQTAGTYNFTNDYFNIGRQEGQPSRNLRGSIDELYIYNRVLNYTEILSLNNSFYNTSLPCVEDWIQNDTICNGQNYTIQFYDQNSCGTFLDLPLNNGTIINCACTTNWIQDANSCINNVELLTYTDSNECNSNQSLPLNNGTNIACTINNNNTFTFTDDQISLLIIGFLIIVALVCAITIHEAFFGMIALLFGLAIGVFKIYSYPVITIYACILMILLFSVMWIIINRAKR